jgi:jumonji domain-containing protein 2
MGLAGITTPYLYIGGYGTIFAWHTEDYDMSSINYMHYGATKFWYLIAHEDSKKFQSYLKNKYPEAFLECSQYFRHKTILVNPYLLKECIPSIRISKIEQKQGEFVLTFGSVYHQGFNLGFNIAESVNFAVPQWLPQFPKFTYCKCHKDNLRIDPAFFCENLLKSCLKSTRLFKNARTPEVPGSTQQKGKSLKKD